MHFFINAINIFFLFAYKKKFKGNKDKRKPKEMEREREIYKHISKRSEKCMMSHYIKMYDEKNHPLSLLIR